MSLKKKHHEFINTINRTGFSFRIRLKCNQRFHVRKMQLFVGFVRMIVNIPKIHTQQKASVIESQRAKWLQKDRNNIPTRWRPVDELLRLSPWLYNLHYILYIFTYYIPFLAWISTNRKYKTTVFSWRRPSIRCLLLRCLLLTRSFMMPVLHFNDYFKQEWKINACSLHFVRYFVPRQFLRCKQ